MRPRLLAAPMRWPQPLAAAAKKHKVEIEIVRNGSRGMLWLEPLVEIEDKGVRYGFGPVEPR